MIVHKDWEIPHVWPDAAPIHAVRDTYEGKGLKQSSVLMGIEPNMCFTHMKRKGHCQYGDFPDLGIRDQYPLDHMNGPNGLFVDSKWFFTCELKLVKDRFARHSQTHQYDHIQEWLCLSENRLPRFDMFH
jgi:hypothetical protein